MKEKGSDCWRGYKCAFRKALVSGGAALWGTRQRSVSPNITDLWKRSGWSLGTNSGDAGRPLHGWRLGGWAAPPTNWLPRRWEPTQLTRTHPSAPSPRRAPGTQPYLARHPSSDAGAFSSRRPRPLETLPHRRAAAIANERRAAGTRTNRRWQQCGVRLLGGGARLPARLATLAAASGVLDLVATSWAAGMEASRCRLGPRGDRSDRGGGWSRLERGGGTEWDRGGPPWELWREGGGLGSGREGRIWRQEESLLSPTARWRIPFLLVSGRKQRLCCLHREEGLCVQVLAWETLGVFVASSSCSLWASLTQNALALLFTHCPAVSELRWMKSFPGLSKRKVVGDI